MKLSPYCQTPYFTSKKDVERIKKEISPILDCCEYHKKSIIEDSSNLSFNFDNGTAYLKGFYTQDCGNKIAFKGSSSFDSYQISDKDILKEDYNKLIAIILLKNPSFYFNNLFNSNPYEPRKYREINQNLSRSAQPDSSELKFLKNKGVEEIIDLRMDFEKNIQEELECQKLGIKYTSIPLNPEKINKEEIEEILKILKESQGNKKIHIHCKDGVDRTGICAFLYKSLYTNKSIFENLEEMITLGHHYQDFPEIIPFAFDFLKEANI